MAVKFRRQAIKFLQRATPEDAARIQTQLSQLVAAIEAQGILPLTDFDIKRMKGKWGGFYRIRVGKIRIIFTVNFDSSDVEIFIIGARGDVYK